MESRSRGENAEKIDGSRRRRKKRRTLKFFFCGKEKSYGFDYVLGLATESFVATQQPISKSVANQQPNSKSVAKLQPILKSFAK